MAYFYHFLITKSLAFFLAIFKLTYCFFTLFLLLKVPVYKNGEYSAVVTKTTTRDSKKTPSKSK